MRSRWHTFVPVLLLMCLVASAYALHRSGIFTVRTVRCTADGAACPDYIQAELDTHRGSSLFFTDFYTVGEEITRLAPSYAHVEITKQFPDVVSFAFSKAHPAYLLVDQSGQPWVIDEAGFVIATGSADTGLPAVYTDGSMPYLPSLRDRLAPELHQNLVTTLGTAETLSLDDATLTLTSEQEARIDLPEKRQALFMLGRSQEQLTKLGYLLKRFDFETIKEPVSEIDLRYEQVILRSSTTSAKPQ